MKPKRWAFAFAQTAAGCSAKHGWKLQAPPPSPISNDQPVWCSEKPGRAEAVSASACPRVAT